MKLIFDEKKLSQMAKSPPNPKNFQDCHFPYQEIQSYSEIPISNSKK